MNTNKLMLDRVTSCLPSKNSWVYRSWGAENNCVIQGEGMEMHLTRISVGAVGVPHLHTCGTTYYILQGTLHSISGCELQHIEVQKEGSFVYVPRNLLHTIANYGHQEVITIVSHDNIDVEKTTEIFPELLELAMQNLKNLNFL